VETIEERRSDGKSERACNSSFSYSNLTKSKRLAINGVTMPHVTRQDIHYGSLVSRDMEAVVYVTNISADLVGASIPFQGEVEDLVFAPTDKPVEDLVLAPTDRPVEDIDPSDESVPFQEDYVDIVVNPDDFLIDAKANTDDAQQDFVDVTVNPNDLRAKPYYYRIDVDDESYKVQSNIKLSNESAYFKLMKSDAFKSGSLFSGCIGDSTKYPLIYEIGSKTPFTGITVEYSRKGFIRERVSYKNGQRNGLIEVFRKGKLHMKVCFENDSEVSMLYCE